MKKLFIPCVVSSLFIASCVPAQPVQEDPAEPAEVMQDPVPSMEEDPPVRETKNVIYQGVVKPAGISIYMQGSHRLQLDDGKFILLESDAVDLNGYVNERVELLGALRPTEEAGGMIMRVEEARLLADEEEDEEDMEEELPPAEEESTEPEPESEPEEEEEPSAPPETEPEELPEPEEETEPTEEPPEAKVVSPELMARTEVMAAESFTSDQWTQQYCTGHIGFCIPVHRNWWFKSFGATSSFLWHVELSSAAVDNLYDGPLHVDLVAGTVASKKATDGQVRQVGDQVIGYKEWFDNRHFEIKADPMLEEAVRYITEYLEEYTE